MGLKDHKKYYIILLTSTNFIFKIYIKYVRIERASESQLQVVFLFVNFLFLIFHKYFDKMTNYQFERKLSIKLLSNRE